ncbi:MAG: hypothetical protein IPK04_10240 [Bdellovibrionales bacterium]|nr:hypothetical protein [Bdellovibrionales bacterium]
MKSGGVFVSFVGVIIGFIFGRSLGFIFGIIPGLILGIILGVGIIFGIDPVNSTSLANVIKASSGVSGNVSGQTQPKDVATYPSVILSHGAVEITNSDGLPPSLSPGTRLRGTLEVKTGKAGSLRIQIDSERSLFIEPNTLIRIPGITWESGELAEIQLIEGRIRLRGTKPGRFTIRVTSLLFDQPWPVGDVLYEMDQEHSAASVYVLEGHVKFSALNAETTVEIGAGKKVTFQGQLEDGEIAYDVLLQGRKVPRGLLSAVTEIAANELKLWDLTEELNKKKRMSAVIIKRKKDLEQLGPGQICRKPKAKYNECAWVCLDNRPGETKGCAIQTDTGRTSQISHASRIRKSLKSARCVRLRCLAQGEWGDSKVLASDEGLLRCQAEPVVSVCDY